MSMSSIRFSLAAYAAVVMAGCASVPSAPLTAGEQATVAGTIASIDTQPWTYDGNALVVLQTATHGAVTVQLPARWNLCKAKPVDVQSLAVGQRATATGTVDADGGLVVCEQPQHQLVRAD